MAETGENTSIVREKDQKKRIIVIVTVALVCFTAIFAAVKVYTSPARQLQRQLDLGQRYLEEMDYEQAIVAFDQAIEIDPMNVDAYLGKAEAYVGLGDTETAVAVLEEGYELTQSDEILKRLEELRGSGGEAAYAETDGDTAEETVEAAVGESGLPYFELGFSPEDFTIAGYSVMDGDHIDDIEQAADDNYPGEEEFDDYVEDYIGWTYFRSNENTLMFPYCSEFINQILAENYYTYSADGYVEISMDTYNGEIPTENFPLFEGKVMINMTTYEEALDILGIKQIVHMMDEEGLELYEFESQYGNDTECRKMENSEDYFEIHIEEPKEKWRLVIGFYDDIVSRILIRWYW